MSRPVRRLVMLLLAVLATLTLRTAAAHDFRVFTVVQDLSATDESGRPPVVARAATLFHAGKVYDYVDAADEVTVFEPTQRRFRILSPSRGLVASVEFDEINQLLKIAREETEKQAAALTGADPESVKAAALLRFQLAPRFEEAFDDGGGTLTLDGGPLRYEVRTTDAGRAGVAAAYLEYADWAARLNYLLHPGPVLPEPRLALNEALAAKGRLPILVTLRADASPPLHLRAEHRTTLELNARDRGMIHQWETQLKSGATRQVTLRDYQRAVLTAEAR
ncbi:MAG TPA: hypothetical protein VF170_02330 [Planctomycetaceae bacterium]